MQVRWMAALALLGIGLSAVGGCSGGGGLSSRLSRLAGVYEGGGLVLTVDGAGRASATLAAGGTLTGLVTSTGSVSLVGTAATAQGTLTESGGTLSILRGDVRSEVVLARRATPTPPPTAGPSATPSPTPTPTPSPAPGPNALSGALFPRPTGATWTFEMTRPGYAPVTKLWHVGAEALVGGQATAPLEQRESNVIESVSFIRSNVSTGYAIAEEQDRLPDGTILRRTTYGQPLLLSYNLVKGQQGFTAIGGGERTSADYLGPVTTRFTASFVRSERVSVAAGTFDCAVLQIDRELSYSIGGAFQSESESRTEWRAEGVGLVKMQRSDALWTLKSARIGTESWPR